MKLALKKLLQAHPSIQVSTLLSGALSTPSAKGVYVTTGMFSIATATAGASTTSLTFSSIPQDYKTLIIRGGGKDNGGSANQRNQRIRFNGDTGSNYAYQSMGGGTQAIHNNGASSVGYIEFGYYGGSDNSLVFRQFIIDLEEYASTTKAKTLKTVYGWKGPSGGTGNSAVDLQHGLWNSTAAITSITITIDTGQAFETGSTFALYGVL